MYHISRQIYRELADDLSPADREHVLRACEATVDRLVNDRHYFARPSQTLFAEIRWRFPLQAQRRVYAVIDRHLRETREYLESATARCSSSPASSRPAARRRAAAGSARTRRTPAPATAAGIATSSRTSGSALAA